MHMTGFGSNDLLKFLQWLLRLVANSLRRPILLLVNLFRRVCAARFSTAGRSMKPRTVAASHVPSISVTADPDPAGISTLASQSSIAAAGQTPAPLTSALLPNRATGRDRSKSASSGYSSDSSTFGYPPGNGNGTCAITPPHMPVHTPTIPGNNMYGPSPASGYPPSSAAPSMTTGLSHGRGKTSTRCRDLVPFGASQPTELSDNVSNDFLGRKVTHRAPEMLPFQRDFVDPRDPSPTTKWRSCVHPEGALYFYNTELHIFTDCDIRRSKNHKPIQLCFQNIVGLAAQEGIVLPDENIEIVLELKPGKDEVSKQKQCMYYLVDKTRRTLFWLHKFDPTEMYGNVKGVREPTHIKCALEMQYCCRSIDPQPRFVEKVTSDTSLAPFEMDELSKMLDIMNVLEGTIGQKNDHLMCVVARFMRMFSRIHFFNFHGQMGARLDVDQSIYETAQERSRTSVVLRTVNLILFGAPAVHSEGLRRVWVDQTVNQPRWKAFVANVNNEWAGFTIYSTVMLAVDVSFLAVPGVESSDPNSDPQPVCVVATYVSILCTIGSLVASVILSSQSRRTGYGSATETVTYMAKMTSTLVGIDHLAIMYSVPYGLLLWGMVFFIVALSDVIFRSSYHNTLILVGVSSFVILVFVFWPIWGGMERYFSNPELVVERVRQIGMFSPRGRVRGSGGKGSRSGGASSGRRRGSGTRKNKRRAGSVSSAGTGGDVSSDSENGQNGAGPSNIV
ncbi:hypothetical protein BDN67DRAFT_1014475 [Paxillus ammoniavirescens]|nr:hypothetical protein BDN67DRAFT_1014475 [Paxillus ammoniavirescens]